MSTEGAPKAAAIYARISQDRTGEQLGVRRQQDDCQAWAQAHGWTVAEVYVDDDISAYSARRRPAYAQLCSDLTDRRRDGLIIWHPDRLHRSPLELEEFIGIVEKSRIPIGTVQAGDLDLTTPTGRMVARIVGATARHESEHKADRIRRKHVEIARAGRPNGGGCRPFGYQDDRLTLRPDEALLVREAADRFITGDTLRAIAADWNRRQLTTSTGKAWQPSTLKQMLSSARIAGIREMHGQPVAAAAWLGIITEAEHRQIRAILNNPARNATKGKTARSYLLMGLVACGHPDCGARLSSHPVTRKGVAFRRYACLTDRGGCNRLGIAAEPLEQLITEAVLNSLETAAVAREAAKLADRATASLVDTSQIQRRLAELAELYAAHRIGPDEWMVARNALTDQLADADRAEAAQARNARLAAELSDPAALRADWPTMPFERRRRIISAVIDRIVIDPTTRGAGGSFNPHRVHPHYREQITAG